MVHKGKRKSSGDLTVKASKRLHVKKSNVTRRRQSLPGTDSDSELEELPLIPLKNQFGLLIETEEKENDSRTEPSAVEKRVKIPPIVVTSVSDLTSFRTQLKNCKETCNLKVSFQVGRRGECRLLTESLQDHQTFVGYLKSHQFSYYTYDTKNARPFKVVLKGLSNDQTVDEIKNELNVLLGFAPSQVILMKKKSNGNNSRLGLTSQFYLIHFNRNEVNNLKILDKVHFLFNVRVKWEHFKRHGGNGQHLTQCRRCQAFGHGTDHCGQVPKCMVCGESSHNKDNCPVKDSTKFKCSNCGENHKSNYWQCPVRKKVLDARAKNQPKSKPIRIFSHNQASPEISNNISVLPTNTTAANSSTVTGRTFANVVSGSAPKFTSTVPCLSQVHSIRNIPSSSNNALGSSDLGEVTHEKLEFLQNSLFELIQTMSNAKTMFEAIQTGLKFANDIVLTLKFNHGSK